MIHLHSSQIISEAEKTVLHCIRCETIVQGTMCMLATISFLFRSSDSIRTAKLPQGSFFNVLEVRLLYIRSTEYARCLAEYGLNRSYEDHILFHHKDLVAIRPLRM